MNVVPLVDTSTVIRSYEAAAVPSISHQLSKSSCAFVAPVSENTGEVMVPVCTAADEPPFFALCAGYGLPTKVPFAVWPNQMTFEPVGGARCAPVSASVTENGLSAVLTDRVCGLVSTCQVHVPLVAAAVQPLRPPSKS